MCRICLYPLPARIAWIPFGSEVGNHESALLGKRLEEWRGLDARCCHMTPLNKNENEATAEKSPPAGKGKRNKALNVRKFNPQRHHGHPNCGKSRGQQKLDFTTNPNGS